MSGMITDMPVRICSRCKKIYIEDDQMYFDTDRCPHCGASVRADSPDVLKPMDYTGHF